MSKKPYEREPNGQRLDFRGMDLVHAPDEMPVGRFPYAQNVRRYLKGRITGRATQDAPVQTMAAGFVNSIRRLNDSTPAGPSTGFILVGGDSAGRLYAGSTEVATGLSGNPVSLIPFRPNASVQPWMYVGDSASTSVKIDGQPTPNGMLKVRSDGTCYAMGIAEPQAAPGITSVPAANQVSLLGPVVVYYFNNPSQSHNPPLEGVYIWKNASDPVGGSSVVETTADAVGSASGNSLLFDDPATNSDGSQPVPWTQYATYLGAVDTNGINVNWISGSQFGGLAAGGTIAINGTTYTIATVPTNTGMTLTASAGVQNDVNYQAAVISGTVPLFVPALESQGYQDFNCAILATLYIPVAGFYNLEAIFKDDMLWGIGNSGTGTVTVNPLQPGQSYSTIGQTKTTINGYPLMPRTGETSGEDGYTGLGVAGVTFSQPGNYPIEIDWNYWYHRPRCLNITCSGLGGGTPKNIPPIPGSAITQAQYRYVYRSSATGATSNPSPSSPEQPLSVLANTLTATPSTDPQVDKIDWYRLDTGLENFTYVGTGPNSAAPFSDKLLDTDVAANPILDFDNFQPFPSIDLPRTGTVNVVNGVANWVSGDQFNIRWLPGTIIIVGTVAYTLDKRPTSTTQLTASNTEIVGGISNVVPLTDGPNQVYEIAEPDLAAQPLPYLWGPTDNVSFFFAVGDPLRPGTLYWSKGNNPDSAPDTNQQDVTSPSEPLINGCLVNGYGWVASSERNWLIVPNFFNALATASGTEGSTWTLQESSLKRGLYIPWCLTVEGGGTVFFRAKDGIYASPGGQGGRSITDEDLYNLFPHEGFTPESITRGPYTVYPPDDTRTTSQSLSIANGYLYYDYADASGTHRTLVYDIAAGGWVPDVYQYPVTCHVLEEGPNANGVLCGCLDGNVRPLTGTGAENCTSVVMMPCLNAGDTRAVKHWGDLYVEAGNEDSE